MTDWQTVRYDPAYSAEKLDPEVIELCDALNAAGFVTTSSCSGHGSGGTWPHVWFEPSDDARIERMVRFVRTTENFDYSPYRTVWQKEIDLDGYAWSVEIHLSDVYYNTPWQVALAKAGAAMLQVARAIEEWYKVDGTNKRALPSMPEPLVHPAVERTN